MKKFIAQVLLAFPLWLMLGSVSFAMCIWFVPPSRQFAPATNMKSLISREGDEVTMTVQPQFFGNATDFALVMPFPSEPTVAEAPETIFTELEDLTNPEIDFNDGIAFATEDSSIRSESIGEVTIIEERDVGDFSTVSLSATSESALTTWLNNEGYEITDEKQSIISNYVNSDGYFVALKVNMDKADVDEDGFLSGELKPISFKFESGQTMLPLRLMSGDDALITLTVYTLADELTYIPGAEVQFSKKVESDQLQDYPGLQRYDAWQKWLVRNVIQIETDKIQSDVSLLTTTDAKVVVPGEQPLIINPDQLPQGTGIMIRDNGVTTYTVEKEPENQQASTTSNDGSSLTTAVVVILAISNIVLLSIVIANHNAGKKTESKKSTPKKKSTPSRK